MIKIRHKIKKYFYCLKYVKPQDIGLKYRISRINHKILILFVYLIGSV